MRKKGKLLILLGVLVVVCVAAFCISRVEQKKEEIKNSGDVVLEIATDSVTALSWTNKEGTFSFTKGEDSVWTYDDDTAFPVDEEKINDLLSTFESFAAAFVIENVEDYSQYGLDEPVATVTVTAGETEYTISLGDVSKMDEERYVSLGDGNAYLAMTDPMDAFDAVLKDTIKDDEIPAYDTVISLAYAGEESGTVVYDEEGKSLSGEDTYFLDGKPLDNDSVEDVLSDLSGLGLTEYVTYNATEDELASYGMDAPAMTLTLDYGVNDENGEQTETGTVTVLLSQNTEEKAAYDEAVANEEETLPEVTCYARVGDSQIVYKITESEFDALSGVCYNTLRHTKLFTGAMTTVSAVEVTLDGETYEFTYRRLSELEGAEEAETTETEPSETESAEDTASEPSETEAAETEPAETEAAGSSEVFTAEKDENGEGGWTYLGEEIDFTSFKSALLALSADEFTDEAPTEKCEISLTVSLDNEDFPSVTITLYRYDGEHCLAVVDGTPVALITRTQAVSLIEAVNALTL